MKNKAKEVEGSKKDKKEDMKEHGMKNNKSNKAKKSC